MSEAKSPEFRKKGARPLLGFYHNLRARFLPIFDRRITVYKYDVATGFHQSSFENDFGISFNYFEKLIDVPSHLWKHMPEAESKKLKSQFEGLFASDSRLYLATEDCNMAAYIWSRPGLAIGRWYWNIREHDVVLYAAGTRQVYRGRGLHRDMMRYSLAEEISRNADAYCDAAAWNKVARRNIEAVGFRPIGSAWRLS